MEKNIDEIVKDIFRQGPSRVMISEAEAVPSRRARETYHVVPDIIFIRKDGWSLAAPLHLEDFAYVTWAEEWTHFIRRPSEIPNPISEYHRAQ